MIAVICITKILHVYIEKTYFIKFIRKHDPNFQIKTQSILSVRSLLKTRNTAKCFSTSNSASDQTNCGPRNVTVTHSGRSVTSLTVETNGHNCFKHQWLRVQGRSDVHEISKYFARETIPDLATHSSTGWEQLEEGNHCCRCGTCKETWTPIRNKYEALVSRPVMWSLCGCVAVVNTYIHTHIHTCIHCPGVTGMRSRNIRIARNVHLNFDLQNTVMYTNTTVTTRVQLKVGHAVWNICLSIRKRKEVKLIKSGTARSTCVRTANRRLLLSDTWRRELSATGTWRYWHGSRETECCM